MTNSTTNFKPIFASTFESMTDSEGYLINQEDLSCLEICDKAIVILRASKDLEKTKKVAKESWGINLPEALGISHGDDGIQSFWISPDEYWIVHSQLQREVLWQKQADLPAGMSLVDNTGAYGALRFKGANVHKLLSRWMGYDLSAKLDVDKVVSTTLGQAPVVAYRENDNELMLLVRHSFSHYVAGLLTDSAKRL
ncbi:MAG: sarcosine oxidase subunit gamma [Gammaproteobacteria bacterium]|nr:sarcosine oxidase subunit gamma [Gammaproteobacteria bacterium]